MRRDGFNVSLAPTGSTVTRCLGNREFGSLVGRVYGDNRDEIPLRPSKCGAEKNKDVQRVGGSKSLTQFTVQYAVFLYKWFNYSRGWMMVKQRIEPIYIEFFLSTLR